MDVLNLSNFGYVFDFSSMDLNHKNIIFGRNGSGKSSIVRAIRESEDNNQEIDLRIYDGFDSYMGENPSFNTIILGKENKEIQNDIKLIQKKVKKDKKKLDLSNKNSELSKFNIAKNNFYNSEKKLTKCKQSIARNLKNEHTNLFGTSFDKRQVNEFINRRELLSNDDVIKLEKLLDESPIKRTSKISFNNFKDVVYKCYYSVNDIVSQIVKPSIIIKDLENNEVKQNFARTGMSIHTRNNDEVCGFCGNHISKDRWEQLDSYFSKETSNLEERINTGIIFLNNTLELTNSISSINEDEFFNQFRTNIKSLNKSIELYKSEVREYINTLLDALNNKKNQLFTNDQKINIPNKNCDMQSIIKEYDHIYSENKNVNDNIDSIKKDAKIKLQNHYSFEQFRNYKFEELNNEYNSSQKDFKEHSEKIDSIKNNIEDNEINIRNKKLEMKDELKAAQEINTLLKSAGNRSFTLKLENNSSSNSEYKILDKSGVEREVSTLSTGEKNVLGFLYFMYNIQSIDGNNKNKIVVLDDPVNSNDSTYQYLIYGYLESFFSKQDCPQTIVLTHNIHFYKMFTTRKDKYEKWKFYHLSKNKSGKSSLILISEKDNDLKDMYNTLWLELKRAYNYDDTIIMWNLMRRILEGYTSFTYNRKPKEFSDKMEKSNFMESVIYNAFYSSLNEHSHIGIETDVSLEDASPEELIDTLKKAFISISGDTMGIEHFKSHWK